MTVSRVGPERDVRAITLLGAPTSLGLERRAGGCEPGCRLAPGYLRNAGLVDRLKARDLGDLVLPTTRDYAPPPPGSVWNLPQVEASTRLIADALQPHLLGRAIPVVLGGDCSILVGIGLAVKRRARIGLIFLDAHTDAYTPATSRSGQVAAMELGIVLGKTVPKLGNIDGKGPYFDSRVTAVVGYRDHGERMACGAEDPAGWTDLAFPAERFKELGSRRVAEEIMRRFRSEGVDGVWIHFDVDVLDPCIMPAVDTPEANGLTYRDVITVVRAIRGASLIAGLDVTIYDPTKDPRCVYANDLAACLDAMLARRHA